MPRVVDRAGMVAMLRCSNCNENGPPPLLKPPSRPWLNVAAFSVHLLTASGAAIALMALIAAVHGEWSVMFGWLGAALVVDAVDGPLARRFKVGELLTNWSGDALDFVVDFTTYVFVPAYAIQASGVLSPMTATPLTLAIVVSSALYFADKRMKTEDNHFRGFPALWNGVAFYVFLLRPPEPWASVLILALVALTFVPVKVIHPVRVSILRGVNLVLMAIWAILAILTIIRGFDVSVPVQVALCLIAAYLVCGEALLRGLRLPTG